MKNDQLQIQYWKRLDRAYERCMKGDVENTRKARDILLEMRRYPNLGIIPRARTNLLLAMVFWNEPSDHYPRLYARECLDLTDIYRQKYDGQWNQASEAQMVEMENQAKDILDDLERFRLEEANDQEPKDTTSIGGNLESLHITSPVKTGTHEVNTGITESEEDGVIITRVSTWTPEAQKECDEERKKNPPFVIEGYLRRSGKYKPVEEYVLLSRDDGLMEGEEEEEDEDEDEVAVAEVEGNTSEQTMSEDDDSDDSGDTILPATYSSNTTKPSSEAMDIDVGLPTPEPSSDTGRQ